MCNVESSSIVPSVTSVHVISEIYGVSVFIGAIARWGTRRYKGKHGSRGQHGLKFVIIVAMQGLRFWP
jgi:hypothetical protein